MIVPAKSLIFKYMYLEAPFWFWVSWQTSPSRCLYLMCLIFTDGLLLLSLVTTMRSNTNICNDSPDGSAKEGLCRYAYEVSQQITYSILVDTI